VPPSASTTLTRHRAEGDHPLPPGSRPGDTNRSGWWQLVSLVPLVGGLVMLVLYLLSGTPGGNRFGEPPAAG